MSRLLIATKNAHKTEEIRAIIGPNWEIVDLTAFPEVSAPEETGTTFHENAVIKALAASRCFSELCVADDSGLEVELLDGAPGVRSARYAGPNATDRDNRSKLLAELGGRESPARFRCALAVAKGNTLLATFEGTVEGRIVATERGAGGFGYVSLFIPHGHHHAFAELPSAEKNRFSHRARALAALRSALDDL
jgi:XTP/dITP diphosphohydrolase